MTFSPIGGLSVTGGGQYLALVRTEPGEAVTLTANFVDPYPGGSRVFCVRHTGGVPVVCESTPDLNVAFEATFLSAATVVPEPSMLALTAGGLFLLGALGARRRTSR